MASSPHRLLPTEVEERLRARFGQDVLQFEDSHGHAVAHVAPSRYRDIVSMLRDDPELAFDFMEFTGGVDYQDKGLEVVTHLWSSSLGHHVRLRVPLPVEDPVCPTISDLYAGANWHERETTEMFGITFDGHPEPVKLLLAEEFDGHPLRKDFPLMSREAKPWPGGPDEDEE